MRSIKSSPPNFDVVGIVNGRTYKLGHAYNTKKGNICIKADPNVHLDVIAQVLGEEGLYVVEAGAWKKTA